jgi:hypothetical protein
VVAPLSEEMDMFIEVGRIVSAERELAEQDTVKSFDPIMHIF